MRMGKNEKLDHYMRIGAMLRMYKWLSAMLALEMTKVYDQTDTNIKRLNKSRKLADQICSDLDGDLFTRCNVKGNKWCDVFFGDPSEEPRNSIGDQMLTLMIEIVGEMFGKKGDKMSKEEIMDDLHEPQPEDTVFEATINALREQYGNAKRKNIERPLIFALCRVLEVVGQCEGGESE